MISSVINRSRLWHCLIVAGLGGCSGGGGGQPVSELPPPAYDASAVAQAALRELDKNKSGTIDSAELNAAPGLRGALSAFDNDRDGAASAAEIQARVKAYATRPVVELTCSVLLDGKPLPNATVVFEPEAFLGLSFKQATAVTNADGNCGAFTIDGKSHVALPAGLYRIRVTKDGTNIPARYNTQTTLGREVFAPPRQAGAMLELSLTSQ